MANGYMGRILSADLSNGALDDEPLDADLGRAYLGGYGIGARLLYDRMAPGVDALGPDNLLGFLTGPLTGTPCIEGNRFAVVCKSPLTATWGDANCGGAFGPQLKFAGYDGVLIRGAAATPVYLLVEDGRASLHDATDLWGLDTNATEDELLARHGKRAQVASIGPAGENLSLLSCIINEKGRAAGRSGVGAVMGSKRLKALVVRGNAKVPLHDEERARALRADYTKRHTGGYNLLSRYGTIGITGTSAMSGDSPVRNWGGVGPVDFKEGIERFDADTLIAYQDRKYGCWKCTMACGGHMSVKEPGPYQGTAHHKVEYETAAAWGTMTLTDDFPALVRINELCNRMGFDTIGSGCAAAFAVECFENGLLGPGDTDGLELRWGNADALVALVEKMARREGIGDLLADGVQRAAARIGRGAEEFAIHVHGCEIPMHDPKYQPALATTYQLDATPGRHTQGHAGCAPAGEEWRAHDRYAYSGKADLQKKGMELVHVVNAAGVCLFAYFSYPWRFVPDFLEAVTGWPIDTAECCRIGERIAQLRHAFNLREGLNPLRFELPARVIGAPPQTAGNLQGVTVDVDTQVREFVAAMDWDPDTAVPSRARLEALGLGDIAADLHGR